MAFTDPETSKGILIDIQHIIAIKPAKVVSGPLQTTIEMEYGDMVVLEHPDVVFGRFKDMAAHGVTIFLK
jgi:hypothetical protein